jgi:putative nucleotidyltransferase with HDIG domain
MAESKQVKDLAAVLEVSRAMMAERDPNRLLHLIANKAIDVLNAERASIFLVDFDTNELCSKVATTVEISEIRFPIDRGISGYVVKTRELVNIKDAYHDSRFNPEIDKKTGYRTNTIICAPLINHKNEVIGALQILNKKRGVFDEHDEELITAFSSQAAVAIENTQLYGELEYTFKQFLKTVVSTIDARDPVTAGHSERVARYAMNMGDAMGFDEKEMKILEYAALLHDVGKIAVRDEILLKEGKFTPAEYAKMKSHAAKTREILENMFTGKEVREIPSIAGAHHENIDGSGYPDGLKNEQLSVAAKILAIADVFEALVAQDRPYKKAMPVEKALAIMEESRGKKFDAEIFDLFRAKKLYLIERRGSIRLESQYMVEYKKNDCSETISAKVINLSFNGLLMKTENCPPLNNIIDLIVVAPRNKLNIMGSVVRVEKVLQAGGFNVAIKFIEKSPEIEKALSALLAGTVESKNI